MFANVSGGNPPGHDSFDVQEQVDGGGFAFVGQALIGADLLCSGAAVGHTYDAQTRYADSASILPPGAWSTTKSVSP
jgi:hypothetical protein